MSKLKQLIGLQNGHLSVRTGAPPISNTHRSNCRVNLRDSSARSRKNESLDGHVSVNETDACHHTTLLDVT